MKKIKVFRVNNNGVRYLDREIEVSAKDKYLRVTQKRNLLHVYECTPRTEEDPPVRFGLVADNYVAVAVLKDFTDLEFDN